MEISDELKKTADDLGLKVTWQDWDNKFSIRKTEHNYSETCAYKPGEEKPFELRLCDDWGDSPLAMDEKEIAEIESFIKMMWAMRADEKKKRGIEK